jgi:hypothetical protein
VLKFRDLSSTLLAQRAPAPQPDTNQVGYSLTDAESVNDDSEEATINEEDQDDDESIGEPHEAVDSEAEEFDALNMYGANLDSRTLLNLLLDEPTEGIDLRDEVGMAQATLPVTRGHSSAQMDISNVDLDSY